MGNKNSTAAKSDSVVSNTNEVYIEAMTVYSSSLEQYSKAYNKAVIGKIKISGNKNIVNTELKRNDNPQKLGYNHEQFYILSIDVARLRAETTICVFKVLPNINGFVKKLVNVEVLPEKLHFEHQAARIKEMIEAYQPTAWPPL